MCEAVGIRHRCTRARHGESAPLRGEGAQRIQIQQTLSGRRRWVRKCHRLSYKQPTDVLDVVKNATDIHI